MNPAASDVSVPLRVSGTAPAAQPPKVGEPCTMVIFGASGDLTQRKLMPALAHLAGDGLLSDRFAIIGVAREAIDDEEFRRRMRSAVEASEDTDDVDASTWNAFEPRLYYVRGGADDANTYTAIAERLGLIERGDPDRGRLFYLAVPPSVYEPLVARLSASGIAPRRDDPAERPWARIILEKPFGRSRATAHALNQSVARCFAEHQVYRIDHYLGKETVQNLLVFRFANSIFEPVWNRAHIHHVQITAAESVGVEHRGRYYEEAGVVRDMFQNHLLQLLCLTAMEPPAAFRADDVRDEKSKVLNAIRPFTQATVATDAVRGQYGPGEVNGERVVGYRAEPHVRADSTVPTWAALRVMIDNWRWQGVPFFLRSGKRMPRRATEITIEFRRPPHFMFPREAGRDIPPNRLSFRLQPDEGIALGMEIKVPGVGVRMTTAEMDFRYHEAFGDDRHSAYETLLLDAMVADQTLFARSDAVELSWAVVDPIIEAWEADPPDDFPNHAAGNWGPDAASALIERDGAHWRTP
jgi:glucose-6-phosphate 1-dehydrogenase